VKKDSTKKRLCFRELVCPKEGKRVAARGGSSTSPLPPKLQPNKKVMKKMIEQLNQEVIKRLKVPKT